MRWRGGLAMTTTTTPKLKDLVHCIVHECKDRPDRLGAVRLNKVLWYADVSSFKEHGEPISGETYVKRQYGPVPLRIGAVLEELRDEGKIAVQEPSGQYDTRKFLSLAEPDPGALSDDERRCVSDVVDAVCSLTASKISDMSHDAIWEAAYIGEEIPVYATLAANEGEITPEVLAWANEAAASIAAGQ